MQFLQSSEESGCASVLLSERSLIPKDDLFVCVKKEEEEFVQDSMEPDLPADDLIICVKKEEEEFVQDSVETELPTDCEILRGKKRLAPEEAHESLPGGSQETIYFPAKQNESVKILFKMSKMPADTTMGYSDKKKRKHLCLTIAQKVQLLEKLASGVSVKHLTEEYGIGKSTIHDLKKQKDKLFKFYAESDEQELMNNRKTLHKAKNEDLDRLLKEWIRHRRSEHLPLNGTLIMRQAKIYHNELKIEGNCDYSTGWLQKFKKRHGIKFLKICSDKASADHEAVEKFIDEFGKVVANENLTPERVCSAEESSLFWRYCPRKTLTTAESVSKLEKVDIEKVFNINNEASVVHSLSNGEIAKVVPNQGDRDDRDNKNVAVNGAEKVPIDNMVKMCDVLIEGLEQCEFITEQEIASVYKIKERLLRQKPLLMRQVALEETF